jgi:demethoxyubiquinone hydroxylase (CLK1/Coq7/Cat5 family)
MISEVQTIEQSTSLDVSIIRPQLRLTDFQIRGHNLARHRVRTFRDALQLLHDREAMAVSLYRLQIRSEMCEHNRELIAALCNKMSHLQDYFILLFEYGARPAKVRAAWWLLGGFLGYGSRLLGRTRVLKTGIRIEKKILRRYEQLLKTIDWEADVRALLEKNRDDAHAHIHRWKTLLHTAEPDY